MTPIILRHPGLVPGSTGPRHQGPMGMRDGGCRDEPGMTVYGEVYRVFAPSPDQRFDSLSKNANVRSNVIRLSRFVASGVASIKP